MALNCTKCGSENTKFHFGWTDSYNSEDYSEYKCEDCGNIDKYGCYDED